MTRSIDLNVLKVDEDMLTEMSIHGELDIQALVFRQIERTHASALQDVSYFSSNVRLLLNMLPKHKKAEADKRAEEYTSKVERWEYKYWCGVPMGTPENPINNSPYMVREEVIDWHKMLEVILETFEECGVTWKFDDCTMETGKVDKIVSPNLPTPLLTRDADVADANISDGRAFIKKCRVCGKRIEPGTGRVYTSPTKEKALVHKDACYAAVEKNWVRNEPEAE